MPFSDFETKPYLVSNEEAKASVCHRLKLYSDYESLYEMRCADKKDSKIDDDKIYFFEFLNFWNFFSTSFDACHRLHAFPTRQNRYMGFYDYLN